MVELDELTEDEVREVFEGWAEENGGKGPLERYEPIDGTFRCGKYRNGSVESMWLAFFAGYRETRALAMAAHSVGEIETRFPSVVIEGPPVPEALQKAIAESFPLAEGVGIVSAIGAGDEITIKVGKLDGGGSDA